MAADSSGEKTEQPTEKRLRDARKKGQVPKSIELSGAASLLAGVLCVMAMVGYSARRLAELQLAIERMLEVPSTVTLRAMALESLQLLALLSLPPVFVAAAVYSFSLWLQVGAVFSLDPLKPKLDNLNPAQGLKKLFSIKSLVNFAIMLIKTAIVGAAVVLVMRQSLPDVIRVIHGNLGSALVLASSTLIHMLLWCGSAFLFLGAVDLGYQRWQFTRDKRMTKSEVRREYREDEGDPHLNAERKRQGREESDPREHLKNLKRSSLLLKDFDGRVVALVYRPSRVPLPLVLMRATGEIAEQAEAEAKRHRVAVVTDHQIVGELFPIAEPGVMLTSGMAERVMGFLTRTAT